MSNLHRIQWIDCRIREKRYPNCSDIAEEFCLSVRQASRDIEYLRYSLGAPVEYSQEKKGYYYTDQSFTLPAIMISYDEKEALSYLADQYKAVPGQMAAQLAVLFERLSGKISGEEDTPAIRDLPVYRVNRQLIDFSRSLQDTIAARQKVRLEYMSAAQEGSCRVVHPLLLFTRQNQLYLAAWCELKEAERTFRISRIRQLEVMTETFSVPVWFDPARYGNDFRFNFREPYTAEIHFEGNINAGKLGLQAELLENGSYRISFPGSTQLFAALVAQAVPFTILSPGWLKRKFFVNFSRILEKNSP